MAEKCVECKAVINTKPPEIISGSLLCEKCAKKEGLPTLKDLGIKTEWESEPWPEGKLEAELKRIDDWEKEELAFWTNPNPADPDDKVEMARMRSNVREKADMQRRHARFLAEGVPKMVI